MPSKPPPIISYHVHITYTLFNPPVVERALALREKTVRTPTALESGTRRETHHNYATHTHSARPSRTFWDPTAMAATITATCV